MSTRSKVLKSISAAVCGGTVKRQIAGSERVWSSDVHTFTTRQSFQWSLDGGARLLFAHLIFISGETRIKSVIHVKRETVNFFLCGLMQDIFFLPRRENTALLRTKFTHSCRIFSVFLSFLFFLL